MQSWDRRVATSVYIYMARKAEPTLNPLTNRICPPPIGRDGINYYDDPEIGEFAISNEVLNRGFSFGSKLRIPGGPELSERETRRLLALAASYVWEAKQLEAESEEDENRAPKFMFQHEIRALASSPGTVYSKFGAYVPTPIEFLLRESRSLTLEAKAQRTLLNLANAEKYPGEGLWLDFNPHIYPGHLVETESGSEPTSKLNLIGLVYGADKMEIPIVMSFLLENGFLRYISARSKFAITPNGYSLIEVLQNRGLIDDPTGFVICRFTKEMDEFYTKCYAHPESPHSKLVRLHRIKDITHNDKIDDRIMQEIRGATIVLVDLTDYNFNIGFEAGYALALRKPIVWTMNNQGSSKLILPFDIQSHNVLAYDPDHLGDFTVNLAARIELAIREAAVAR